MTSGVLGFPFVYLGLEARGLGGLDCSEVGISHLGLLRELTHAFLTQFDWASYLDSLFGLFLARCNCLVFSSFHGRVLFKDTCELLLVSDSGILAKESFVSHLHQVVNLESVVLYELPAHGT